METNVALICIAKIFQESLHYIYNDENIDLQIIIDQIEALRSNPQRIPKIEGYVEFVIPLLNSMQFQSHFRYVYCHYICFLQYTVINVYLKMHNFV